ncbi:MAG: hypothetical protein Q7S74_03240 [Nanoarchaeota archaeon]|nr:hypothetical protein [Nanoarchaeota archaeon]
MRKILLFLILIPVLSFFVYAIPNLASSYCVEQGYNLSGESCIFPDNTSCPQWDFYNKICGQNYVKEISCAKEGETKGVSNECCSGLTSLETSKPIGGVCSLIVGGYPTCSNCGNGKCDPWENSCNCPSDCGSCIGDGERVGIVPNPSPCCNGLTLIPPEGQFDVLGGVCTSKCGDGVCDFNTESINNCPQDCKNSCVVYYPINSAAGEVMNKTDYKIDSCVVKRGDGYFWYTGQCSGENCFSESNHCEGENIIDEMHPCKDGCEDSACVVLDIGIPKLDNKSSDNKITNEKIKGSVLGTRYPALENNLSDNKTINEKNKTFHLSNGRNALIKILPETASERAREQLGDLGFNVTLKEVGKGNETQVVYLVEGEKEDRIFGLFRVKGKVSVEVDAETGAVVSMHKPWWAFLASGI